MIDLAEPDRNTWCTPRTWALAVGHWDLDPCSNERSHIQAARTFRLDHGQDGLALARTVAPATRVWINPPFGRGEVIRWVRAYRHTRFCFLVRLDPSTEWFDALINASETLLVPRGERIEFDAPPGVRPSKNPFPHVLAYADHRDVTPAVEALCFEWRVI